VSQASVDVVLDQFAATNERDFERAMRHYAEEVVLVVPDNAFLQSGTYTGREAVGNWFGDWFRTFEPDYRFEIEAARDLGDRVFLDATHRGRGRASGAQVHGRNGYLYTVSDGKITRVELYATPAEALAAGGVVK
jgi:ketosteroid isomerase-like protein